MTAMLIFTTKERTVRRETGGMKRYYHFFSPVLISFSGEKFSSLLLSTKGKGVENTLFCSEIKSYIMKGDFQPAAKVTFPLLQASPFKFQFPTLKNHY